MEGGWGESKYIGLHSMHPAPRCAAAAWVMAAGMFLSLSLSLVLVAALNFSESNHLYKTLQLNQI